MQIFDLGKGDPEDFAKLLKSLGTPDPGPLEKLLTLSSLINEGADLVQTDIDMIDGGEHTLEALSEHLKIHVQGLRVIAEGVHNHVMGTIWEAIEHLEDMAGKNHFNAAMRAWSLARITKDMNDDDAKDYAHKIDKQMREMAQEIKAEKEY